MKPDATQPYAIVVNADSFDRTPRLAEQQAKEMVERALGKAAPVETVGCCCGPEEMCSMCPPAGKRTTTSSLDEMLKSTALADAWAECDIPMKTVRIPYQCGERDDLSKMFSERLGTPYKVTVERSVAQRSHSVTSYCMSCKQTLMTWADDRYAVSTKDLVEHRANTMVEAIETCRKPDFHEEGDCRCVDGLPLDECLRRYEWAQRDWATYTGKKYASSSAVFLTARQKEAASAEWSAALKRRQQEAKGREFVLACDDDRWEP